MAKIYTRTGDDGTTGLFGGPRVRKNSARPTAYGDVDELNASLGSALAEMRLRESSSEDRAFQEALIRRQHELFALGAELASPDPDAMKTRTLSEASVARLETEIDRMTEVVPPLRQFVLPGGSPEASRLHLARCICRRAERSLLSLADAEPDADFALATKYLNRLSDWLFAAARFANFSCDVEDVPWNPDVYADDNVAE